MDYLCRVRNLSATDVADIQKIRNYADASTLTTVCNLASALEMPLARVENLVSHLISASCTATKVICGYCGKRFAKATGAIQLKLAVLLCSEHASAFGPAVEMADLQIPEQLARIIHPELFSAIKNVWLQSFGIKNPVEPMLASIDGGRKYEIPAGVSFLIQCFGRDEPELRVHSDGKHVVVTPPPSEVEVFLDEVRVDQLTYEEEQIGPIQSLIGVYRKEVLPRLP